MKHFQIICLIILFFGHNTLAQKNDKQTTERLKMLEAVKNGTTYIIVKDVNFPDHEKYLAELRKRWTLSRDIQYISIHNNKFDLPVASGDSFFSIDMNTIYGDAFGIGSARTFYNLAFWALNDDFSKNNKPFLRSSQYVIGFSGYESRYFLSSLSFDFEKSLFFHFDGYPGILSNIMQNLTLDLTHARGDSFTNDQVQLKTLANDTLYIPEFDLYKKGSDFMNRKLNEAEANKTLKGFPLPYKILSCADIEKKIILSPTPFYYLLHDGNETTIVNSKTGVNIYFAKSNSSDLDGNDLKKIVKVINN